MLLILARTVGAQERIVYVAPTGNDRWAGTLAEPDPARSNGPLATPAHARDVVRAMLAKPERGLRDVRVLLRGGTYFLSQPMVLTTDDSSDDIVVSWSAFPNEHPLLSGGEPLTGWTKIMMNGKPAWVTKMPADLSNFRELWFDGARLSRARWPKRGTLTVAAVSGVTDKGNWMQGVDQFTYSGDDVKAWSGILNGEAIIADRWAESHLPIASIDESAHTIHFAKKSVFQLMPGDRYWVENIRECLTDPGEFYVSPQERSVYLIPPGGADSNHAQVIAPRLEQLLLLQGAPAHDQFVRNLAFQGIGFGHTEWYFDRPCQVPPSREAAAKRQSEFHPHPDIGGFTQAAIGVPATVWGMGVRNCLFDKCDIVHTGTYGIELSQGCQKNLITRCHFSDLGAGGVKIGERAKRDDPAEQTLANQVSNCTIVDGGRLYPGCVAVWIGQSAGNRIAHNDVHGFWYTAISVGWTWGYGPSGAHDNIIEYNHIHHIGQPADGVDPILSDMGAVYTLGGQPGTVVRFNRFHDIGAAQYGGWGIYFDEGSTGIVAENNLVYRTTHGGFHQHYGKANIVRNNIFAFGRDQQMQRTRIEDHPSFTFEHNIMIWDQGTLLAGDWHQTNVVMDFNRYWLTTGKPISFAGRTWDQWHQAGEDLHSQITDPHFVNPRQGDFRLTPESDVAAIGFKPFDLSTVGSRSQ